MAKRPLGIKPVSPIIPVALSLKAKGYDPIPMRDKTSPFKGWPEAPNTPEDIAGWHGQTVALRMSGSGDLFAIDLDVQRQDILDTIIDRYRERWPEFLRDCVIRHSGAVKVMLIGRLVTTRRYMHSGRYGVTEEHPGGNRVELFTSNDSRYIAVWGLHSKEEDGTRREYGYDGMELHEVEIGALPEFQDADLNDLLSIANEVMEAAGLPQHDPPGEDTGDIIYDMTRDMMADLEDGRRMSLGELEEAAKGEFIYIHGRLLSPGSEHFRIKCKTLPWCGLVMWDWGEGGVEHRWKEQGFQPKVLGSLLKQLEAAEAARTAPAGGGGGGGTTVFTPTVPAGAGRITQDEAALLFADTFGEELKYCHDTGRWYHWTGVYWQPEGTKLAFQYARELARFLSEQSRATELKEVRKISFAGGVEKFAQGDRLVATRADNWNKDIYLLGTPDGTLDLRTGALRAPDPADGITRLAACSPNKAMKTPRFDRFMRETFHNDMELIRFAQEWFGYCMTGDISEHALWFGFGEGGNGKGVLINTMTGIMKDYAVTAAMDTFTAAKGDRHSTELAMLQGARLVTASETEKGRAWAEARIKQITGGDPITARFMRQDNFTFIPQFKLTLVGNHKPVLRGVDDAIKRRFNLVPFLNKPTVVNKRLERELRAEWPGIMQWMLEGCLAWMATGLARPAAVKAATEDYFADQDIVQQWLDDCCDLTSKTAITPTTNLFSSWKDYADRAGEYVGNRKTFATELTRRGFELFKHGNANVRSVRGITLGKTTIAKAILSIVPKDVDETKKDEK